MIHLYCKKNRQLCKLKNRIKAIFYINIFILFFLWSSCILEQEEPIVFNKNEALVNIEDQAIILTKVNELLKNRYVKKENIDSNLIKLNDFTFNDIEIASYFAEQITQNLMTVFNDKHLMLYYDSALVRRLKYEQRVGDDWNDIQHYEAYLEYKDAVKDHNYDFSKLEILPGNTGYIKFNHFARKEEAKLTIKSAMNFMANSNALILDLQHNSGGHVNTTSFLGSFFLEDTATVFFKNLPGEGKLRYPAEDQKGPENLKHIPLYVIVSENTASAAEVLTNSLKENRRATIIGSTTWGGAHACQMEIINDGFALLLPFSEILGPTTEKNWEGIGIVPDIVKSSNNIIDNVHHLAISDMLSKTTNPKERYKYTGILKAIESKFYKDGDSNLDEYAGTFGYLKFYIENDQLFYLRDGRNAIGMTSYKKDHFILETNKFTKIYFSRNKRNKVNQVNFARLKDTLVYTLNR